MFIILFLRVEAEEEVVAEADSATQHLGDLFSRNLL